MAQPHVLAKIGKDITCYKKEREKNIYKEVREVAITSMLADGEMGVDAVQATVKKYGIFFSRIIGVGWAHFTYSYVVMFWIVVHR